MPIMEQITSRSNTRIKSARALRHHKQRDKTGLFLVEGIHHVGAAIEAEAQLEAVFYAPDLLESEFARELVGIASTNGVPCYPTASAVFASLSGKENPQGILAVLGQSHDRFADLDQTNFSWGVACVSPQDPGNVGTILRTVDAVGADGLILIDGGVDPYHPTAVRASMGALFRHPVVTSTFPDFALWARENGYHVYGSSAREGIDYQQFPDYQRPAILLMGSEKQGLTDEQARFCEQLIQLPMKGEVTSLNLAVAAGILLYRMFDKLG
jgi:TrmH family RNA methyltransferase